MKNISMIVRKHYNLDVSIANQRLTDTNCLIYRQVYTILLFSGKSITYILHEKGTNFLNS